MVKRENKTSDRAQNTKAHIINSFLILMKRKHWGRISVKELCEEAAVTRGTFYQYFDSINGLMDTIESTTIAELQNAFQSAQKDFRPANVLFTQDFDRDFSVEPSYYSLAWFRYCQENELKMTALLNAGYSDIVFINRLKDIISTHLAMTMNREGLPDDKFRVQYLSIYSDMYICSVFTWFSQSEKNHLTAEEMALVLDSIRTGGIYTARRNRLEDFTNGRTKK